MRLIRKLRVKNALGLHARPATVIAQLAQETKSSVSFTYKKETVDARSIMSLLTLAATKNSIISVLVEGEDAEAIMNKLILAFETKFGE